MAHCMNEFAARLDGARETLAVAIVGQLASVHPDITARWRHCREDVTACLAHLAEALAIAQPTLFREHVHWLRAMLAGRGLAGDELSQTLGALARVLDEQFESGEAALARRYVESVLADLPRMAGALSSVITDDHPLATLARAYLEALLAGRRHEASRLIIEAAERDTSIKDLYIHVFQRTQHEIGRLWQLNEVTVAQEHYCTAATQLVMSMLYPRIFAGPRIGRTFIGACASGDLHEIGIRMVTDFFEMDGWDTQYLGASVPTDDLVRMIAQRRPDVVGISATMTPHLSIVAKLVDAIRAEPACRDVKILVGGYPLTVVPDLWRELGADGSAPDAQGAVDAASKLVRAD